MRTPQAQVVTGDIQLIFCGQITADDIAIGLDCQIITAIQVIRHQLGIIGDRAAKADVAGRSSKGGQRHVLTRTRQPQRQVAISRHVDGVQGLSLRDHQVAAGNLNSTSRCRQRTCCQISSRIQADASTGTGNVAQERGANLIGHLAASLRIATIDVPAGLQIELAVHQQRGVTINNVGRTLLTNQRIAPYLNSAKAPAAGGEQIQVITDGQLVHSNLGQIKSCVAIARSQCADFQVRTGKLDTKPGV